MTTPVLTSVAIIRSGKMPLSSARKLSDTGRRPGSQAVADCSRMEPPGPAFGRPDDKLREIRERRLRCAPPPFPPPQAGRKRGGKGEGPPALADDWLDGKAQSPYELRYPVVI